MPTIQDLVDEVQKLHHDMHDRIDVMDKQQKKLGEELISKNANVGSNKSEFDAINGRINEVMDQLKELRIADARPPLDNDNAKKSKKAKKYSAHHQVWMKALRNQCEAATLTSEEKSMTMYAYMPAERKDLYAGDATTGGFFAATDFIDELLEYRLLISPMRTICRQQTTSGEKVQMPALAADASAYWATEQSSFTNSTDPTVSMVTIPVHEVRGLLRVSEQNLEDSMFDLESLIKERLMLKFAQTEGTAFVSGNGNGKPRGILSYPVKASSGYTGGSAGKNNVTDAIPYVATGQAATITADSILNVAMDLKAAYDKNSTYIMTRGTLNSIRLLKDSQNRPLWQPFGGSNLPATIYDRPYVEMPDMQEIAANNYCLIVGDFSYYMIVDRVTLNIRRLEELYAAQGLVGFIARMRVGGDVLLPEAFRVLKVATS